MKITVRPVKQEDVKHIHSFLIKDEVCSNVTLLPSMRLEESERFIGQLSERDHYYVAEVDESCSKRVVGCVSIVVHSRARQNHSASFGITVDPVYHNRGVAKVMMDKIIDLADNWLLLKRIELDVVVDNEIAINLYKKYGFVTEGIKKYAIVKDGKYADLMIMARYK